MMRKAVSLTLTLALLLSAALLPAAQARAADIKPVGVVSLAGYNSLKADAQLMTDLAGKPEIGQAIDGIIIMATHGYGLKGLDKERPWGVLVGTDGHEIGGCAFVPVTDFKAMMKTAMELAADKVEKESDGIYKIKGPKKTLYAQETHKGWAFFVDDPAIFEYVPANPGAALEGLNEEYDVAMRLYPANMPWEMREKVAKKVEGELKKHAKKHEKKWKRCKGDDCEARSIMRRHAMKQLEQLAEDLEQVTLGVKLDQDTQRGIIELSLACQPHSPAARFLASADDTVTAFACFDLPEAVLSARMTGREVPLEESDLRKVTKAMRKQIREKISKKLGGDDVKGAMKLVDQALGVVEDTMAAGRNDQAFSVRIAPDAATLIAGRFVADGMKLEEVVKTLVHEAGKRCPEVDAYVELDVDQCAGVNLHLISVPMDECPKGEKIAPLVGDELNVVLGFAPEAVYIAAGRDAMQSLKVAIKDSADAADEQVAPGRVLVDLGAWAASAQGCPVDKVQSKGEKIAAQLAKAFGRDEVHAEILATERGLKMRLVLEEGTLRVIATGKKKWRK